MPVRKKSPLLKRLLQSLRRRRPVKRRVPVKKSITSHKKKTPPVKSAPVKPLVKTPLKATPVKTPVKATPVKTPLKTAPPVKTAPASSSQWLRNAPLGNLKANRASRIKAVAAKVARSSKNFERV